MNRLSTNTSAPLPCCHVMNNRLSTITSAPLPCCHVMNRLFVAVAEEDCLHMWGDMNRLLVAVAPLNFVTDAARSFGLLALHM